MVIKKIKTQDEINKSRRKKQFIVGGVLIFILMISMLLVNEVNDDSGNSQKISINGLDFFRIGDIWRVKVYDTIFQFSYLPTEVQNISVNGTFDISEFSGSVIYVNDYGEGAGEFIGNFGRFFQRYQKACYVNETCDDLPVKDCSENFIVFKSGENSVYKKENCVFIVGDSVKGADALMYKVLKIN